MALMKARGENLKHNATSAHMTDISVHVSSISIYSYTRTFNITLVTRHRGNRSLTFQQKTNNLTLPPTIHQRMHMRVFYRLSIQKKYK